MAQGFQSSFIPKGSAAQEGLPKKKMGIFGLIAVSVFALVIILSIGLAVYKSILEGQIENLKAQLAEAGRNIDKKSIDQMLEFSKKLSMAKSIVENHQVISGFTASLASSTVSTVSFDDFNYRMVSPGELSVVMRGKAKDYASLALQESVFRKNQYWKSVSFTNMNLGEGGLVSFEVTVSVDPKITVYSPYIPEEAKSSSSDGVSQINSDLKTVDSLDNIELDASKI